MQGHIDSSASVIKAKSRCDLAQKTSLSVDRKAAQPGGHRPRIAGSFRTRDFANQWNELLFQFREQSINGGSCQAGVMFIQHVIIRRICLSQVSRFTTCQLHIFFQHRRVTRKIIRRFGPSPGVISPAALRGFLTHKFRR